jgi:hypothetical protein
MLEKKQEIESDKTAEENSEPIYILTPEQRRCVEEGIAQIERGEFISNEELEREEDEWLNE